MRTSRLAPFAVACLLVLSACDGGGATSPSATPAATPSATPTLTPVVTPSATPTLTPTPAFNPHPPLGDLLITTRGLLPLTHTDPIVGNAGEQMLEWDEDYCYSEEMGITTDTGRWVATYPNSPFLVDGHIDDAVHRIDIASPAISTPEGVHIGTPLPELLAAYPFIIMGTPGFATDVYWIVDVHGIVVFETGVGTPMGGAGPEQVWYIRILGPEWDPDWTVAQSGNVANACF